jgi:hypothetical protein
MRIFLIFLARREIARLKRTFEKVYLECKSLLLQFYCAVRSFLQREYFHWEVTPDNTGGSQKYRADTGVCPYIEL